MKILMSSVILLLFFAKGCNDKSLSPENMGGQYVLNSFEGKSMSEKEMILTIDSEENTLSGNVGCNTFTSAYRVDGNQVSFKTPFSTKMYCPETAKQERAFFEMLPTVERVEAEDGKLLFYNSKEEQCFVLQKK